jgi:hypothetical protein
MGGTCKSKGAGRCGAKPAAKPEQKATPKKK